MWRALGAEPYPARIGTWDIVPPRHERAEGALLRLADDVVHAYGHHTQEHGMKAPVFIHSFSNAGYLSWGTLQSFAAWAHGYPTTSAIQPRNRFDRKELVTLAATWMLMRATRGNIIDSAPSRATPEIWTRFVLESVAIWF